MAGLPIGLNALSPNKLPNLAKSATGQTPGSFVFKDLDLGNVRYARAPVADPAVLVLDEATSALDMEAQAHVLGALPRSHEREDDRPDHAPGGDTAGGG